MILSTNFHGDKSQGNLIPANAPVITPRPVRLWALVVKVPEHLEDSVPVTDQVRYFSLKGKGVSDVVDVLEQMGIGDDLLTVIEWAAVPMVLESHEDIARLIMGNGALKGELVKLARQHGGCLTDEILDGLNPPAEEIPYAQVVELATFVDSADGLSLESRMHRILPPLPGVSLLVPRSLDEQYAAKA